MAFDLSRLVTFRPSSGKKGERRHRLVWRRRTAASLGFCSCGNRINLSERFRVLKLEKSGLAAKLLGKLCWPCVNGSGQARLSGLVGDFEPAK